MDCCYAELKFGVSNIPGSSRGMWDQGSQLQPSLGSQLQVMGLGSANCSGIRDRTLPTRY